MEKNKIFQRKKIRKEMRVKGVREIDRGREEEEDKGSSIKTF